MTMKYIQDYYGVPAQKGRKVQIYRRTARGEWILNHEGRITSASHYIKVDGLLFHPTEGVVYLDEDGKILKDTRES